MLSAPFVTVGLEKDPISGVLYACTGGQLRTIDEITGQVTTYPSDIFVDQTCNDVGATWEYVECLDLN